MHLLETLKLEQGEIQKHYFFTDGPQSVDEPRMVGGCEESKEANWHQGGAAGNGRMNKM